MSETTVRQAPLLVIPNHHPTDWPAPKIERKSGDYLRYYENEHGEQLVFYYDPATNKAILYHGDMEWEPREVDVAKAKPFKLGNAATGDVVLGGVILGQDEASWIMACWNAANIRRAHLREKLAESGGNVAGETTG